MRLVVKRSMRVCVDRTLARSAAGSSVLALHGWVVATERHFGADVAAVKCETQLITCSLAADIPDIWSRADFTSRTGHLALVG